MSVAAHLGLDDPDCHLLTQARRRWATWQIEHPALAPAPPPARFRGWLRMQPPAAADVVLVALAELSACDAGDDVAAAGVLCWVLLPGACRTASQLRALSPEVDQLVAGQLWLEVRSGRPPAHKVAANIVMNTRKGVHRQLGLARPTGSRWRRTTLIDPSDRLWLNLPDLGRPDTAAAELRDLLERACRDQVISREERLLLVRLAQESDHDAGARCGRRAGLTSTAATAAVSAEFGISERTTRRRVQRSISALTEAYSVEKVTA